MAMTILNNPTTMMTLGELNKNITNQSKNMKKLSSGTRINSAQDDASGFAISEKMRVMIRGLDQDEKNVKNGSSLLRVAAGGIENIVDELRNLKELALNAANDSNTDADRATIQKEFDQKMVNINDIASETNYNGKLLLNGDYRRPQTYLGEIYTQGAPQTTTIVVGQRLERVQIGTKQSPVTKAIARTTPNKIEGIASAFRPGNHNTKELTTGQGQRTEYNQSSKKFSSTSGRGTIDISAKIDFSGMSKPSGGAIDIPSDLDEQGFSILCSACSAQYITIKFDSSSDTSTFSGEDRKSMTYTIGIKSVTTINELEDALFNGIKNASGKPTSSSENANTVLLDNHHNVRIAKDPSGDGYVFLKEDMNGWFNMGIYDKGTVEDIFLTTYQDIPEYGYKTVDIEQTITTYPLVPEETWIFDPGRPLVIHHGPRANQALNVYINDMHTDAMELTGTKVTTQKLATEALEKIDHAIDYTLDEATTIGAYISRLEYTEGNIVTANENTQSSESTIRDADMAREMLEYTKNNVLSQASQSMLAQANQNLSSVLSLLQ